MPRFLNTEGMSTLAIAVCDRCKMKRPLAVMGSDPNFPGLRVCDTMVLPDVPSGNTATPAVAIGDLCGQFIREDIA